MGKKQILVLLLLFTVFDAKPNYNIELSIKVNEITKNNIQCDFLFDILIDKNDSVDFYIIALPFGENKLLDLSTISNETELIVATGFSASNNGIAIINSLNRKVHFKTEFINVVIPIKKVPSENDGLLVNLPLTLSNDIKPNNISNIKQLNINEITLETDLLINSFPKYKLADKGKYTIKMEQPENNMYFIIPNPQDSFVKTFLAFLIIAILLGFIGAFKLLKGKTESWIGLISSVIALGLLTLLFINKVIPTDFNKDLDMISLVGGGIGFFLGILLNSGKNLIEISAIARQQPE